MITFYIILGLLVSCAICVLIIVIQAKSAKKYKAENKNLHIEIEEAVKSLTNMKALITKNKAAGVEANEQRQQLAQTSDTNLVERANGLFVGNRVRD